MSQEEQPDSAPDTSPDGAPVQPFVITLPDDPASGNDWYLWAGVLALLTLVAFWQAISGTFLWDDDHQITLDLSLRGLLHIWTRPLGSYEALGAVQYYPLTNTFFWTQDNLWGKSPLGFHVVNLALHALSAMVLWRVLRRLAVPGAWVAAAVWAVHPLQAESVCWISELKNVLSGVLVFSSLLFFLEYAGLRDPDSQEMAWKLKAPWQAYAISVAFFALAMFSKTVACSLAPALLVILWWKRHLNAERTISLISYFVIGVALSVVTAFREVDPNGTVQASGPEWQLSFAQRLLVAGRGFWFYIGKIFVPTNLSFNYARIIPQASSGMSWFLVLAALAVIAVLYAARETIGRGALTTVLCYGLALFPSLGFVNVYPFRYSFVADHFQYLAGVSLIALAVAIAVKLISAVVDAARLREPAAWQAAPSAILLVILAAAAWNRSKVYFDAPTLWRDVLNKNPGSILASFNLAREERSDSALLIGDSIRASQSGDAEAAKATAFDATALLDDARKNLRNVIQNPQATGTTIFQSQAELADGELTRAGLPGADALSLAASAEEYARQAIAGEKVVHNTHPDPTPYYTMGMVKMMQADGLRNLLFPATTRPAAQTRPSLTATTLPTTSPEILALRLAATRPATTQIATTQSATTRMAATRPATANEERILEPLEAARANFLDAIKYAHDELMKNPNARPLASRIFALAAFQRGNADVSVAAIAKDRDDIDAMQHYTAEAISDFLSSLRVNDANVEAHFSVAKCLLQFGQLDQAITHLRAALYYAPNHQYAPAYDEIGIIMLASGHPTLDQLYTALQCFQDAQNLDPDSPDYALHLSWAKAMLELVRTTTGPSTEPTTQATTLPATMP